MSALRSGSRKLAIVGAGMAVIGAVFCLLAATAMAATPSPLWAPPSGVSLPNDASTLGNGQYAQINGISCTSTGNCVAVGSYKAATGSQKDEAMVVTETNGVWGQASAVALPTGAASGANPQYSGLGSVACQSQGNCVAVGGYTDSSGSGQAMVATEHNGVWGQAIEVTPPIGAITAPGAQAAELTSVWCATQSSCVAVGYYLDSTDAGQAMIVTESNSAWGQATELTLPATAVAGASQYATLDGVSCSSAGDCAAVGYYSDANAGSAQEAMVAGETNGTWSQATEVDLPADATQTSGAQDAWLFSVSCTGASSCVAVGAYADSNGTDDGQAMAVSETPQGWGQAVKVALPTPSANGPGDQDATLYSVSCVSTGNCVAGGNYTPTAQVLDPMVAVETDGTWAPATESALPSDAANAASQNAAILAVTCTAPGACVEGGFYRYTSGSYYQALLDSSVPVLSISTTSLPSGAAGSNYQTSLAASGGAGTYTWSLSSGSLPPGLTLNPSTGVISGTPQTTGTSDFTVTVSDPGLPAQSVSAPLSIQISAPAPTPVPIVTPSRCPEPTGTLSGTQLGPLRLGMTRAQARQELTRFDAYTPYTDNFCLAGGAGIRVGYATANVLAHLHGHPRASGIVLALTANPNYAIDGIRPGTSLHAAAAKLSVGDPIHRGLNWWYLIPHPGANWVLKVRHGVILGIGIASRQLTAGRPVQAALLARF